MNKKNCGALAGAVAVLLMPLALVLTAETVARLSLADALRWVALPESANTLRFTFLWFLFAWLFVFAAINRLRGAAVLLLAAVLAVATLHAGKLILLQQPLVPGDITLLGSTTGIWSAAYFPFTWPQVAGFLALLAGWILFCRRGLPRWRLDGRRRLLLLAASGAALFAFTRYAALLAAREVPPERKLTTVWRPESNTSGRLRTLPGIQNPDFSAAFNYTSFGLVAGFLHNLNRPRAVDRAGLPDDPRAVARAWTNLAAGTEAAPAQAATGGPPHVVIVLSESFWDPTALEGLAIDPDPLPEFRRLATGPNGCAVDTVSPIFGGYTCNAEFEVLTGIAMAALPARIVPHRHGFKGWVPALPSVFKEQGYATIAVHPFLPDFWNRNLVYPRIGFDRFIHIGNLRHQEVKGKFISDSAAADEVIALLDEATAPTFLLLITMQNHSPYGDRRYGEVETRSVTITSPTLHADSVRDYVHGLRDADAMLGKLTSHLAGMDRRVLLLFLGDHQPNLIPPGSTPGAFTQRLRETAGRLPVPSVTGKHQGVALLWSSRGPAPEPPPGPVSLAALPARLLREAGLALPPFFRISEQVFHAYPVLNRNWGVSEAGALRAFGYPLPEGLLRDYQVICQDILLGRNHSRAHLRETNSTHAAVAQAAAPAANP